MFVKTNSSRNRVEWEKITAGSNPCIAGEVRPIVLKCLDIFKHLRGLKLVDKIKKYRRDFPRAIALTSAVYSHPSLCSHRSQKHEYNDPRKSLPVFLIIELNQGSDVLVMQVSDWLD